MITMGAGAIPPLIGGVMQSIYNSVMKPFRDHVSFPELLMWIFIYAIVAYVVYDVLKIIMTWAVQTAEG